MGWCCCDGIGMGWMMGDMYYMIYDALSPMDRQKEGGMIAGVPFVCSFVHLILLLIFII